MRIFKKLRWKLTLNYTIVTVSAFLVVLIILGGIILPRIFIPINVLTPEGMIRIMQRENTPIINHILSQKTVDTELLRLLLKNPSGTITNYEFLRIGSLQFSVNTIAMLRALIIDADGTLLGKSEFGFPESLTIGKPFDPKQFPGVEAPYRAALAGDTNLENLYKVYEPNNRFVLAIPFLDPQSINKNYVDGVMVLWIDSLPTQKVIPSQILNIAGKSLLIFFFGISIMGAIFGAFFARGLSDRFKRLSTTIDAWSGGDFSNYINDPTGDEISQLSLRLNNMAKQLQELLRRRQDMAVSEERNRLARDLHDSAKQQALAASFQIGTALTLYNSDPQNAKKHLVEADGLVDAVRNELTNLVQELRPQSMEGQDFSEILKEYTFDWSQRSGIEINVTVEGSDEPSVETREALYRIAQEALANVARHSSARSVELSLKYESSLVTMMIRDDGDGFDVSAPHNGLGLSSMRERTEVLGGTLTIKSDPGHGTQIIVTLPTI
jgi:two-component system, NarL family, sensor histidine kinase LiaS